MSSSAPFRGIKQSPVWKSAANGQWASIHVSRGKTGLQRSHELLVAGRALPFGGDALDRLGTLGQGCADEIADEAIKIGVLTSRLPFKQAEHFIWHMPLHEIEGFFAGQALMEAQLGSDTLGKWPAFHRSRIA